MYLKVDLDRLLASPERQTTDATTVDGLLIAYRQPHRAICVTLAMHQVGVADTTALRIRDADPNGVITTRGTRRVTLGKHAAAALRAQTHLRLGARATADDGLLTVTDRAISQALNDANLDLNIRVHGRRAERHQHPRRWLTALGLIPYELP
jgi:hypothetical protein